jgi:hypothetical protein
MLQKLDVYRIIKQTHRPICTYVKWAVGWHQLQVTTNSFSAWGGVGTLSGIVTSCKKILHQTIIEQWVARLPPTTPIRLLHYNLFFLLGLQKWMQMLLNCVVLVQMSTLLPRKERTSLCNKHELCGTASIDYPPSTDESMENIVHWILSPKCTCHWKRSVRWLCDTKQEIEVYFAIVLVRWLSVPLLLVLQGDYAWEAQMLLMKKKYKCHSRC